MKKFVLIFMVAAACILAGCGLYDKEYLSINEYKPAEVSTQSEGTFTVKTSIQLKKIIRDMVYNQQTEGSVRFDPSYEGDPETDIHNVCMQLRLNDALCAYCEVKFSFRLNHIVNYSEAVINVSYSPITENISNIISLPYSVGVEDYILKALDSNSERLVILISASSYSSLKMRTLVSDVFRQSPTICPVEPDVNVYMYSGEDNQRLYEINFKYSLSEDELIRRKSLIKNLDITTDINTDNLDELHKVYALCKYFSTNCSISEIEGQNTLYDAMIMHRADSEGISLAFVETAHRLGLNAEIVYGQYSGADCCWNIVEIEGQRYHIDVTQFIKSGITEGFIKNDDAMSQVYRWDASQYERCTGRFTFLDLPEYLPEGYIFVLKEAADSNSEEESFIDIIVEEIDSGEDTEVSVEEEEEGIEAYSETEDPETETAQESKDENGSEAPGGST